MVDPDTMFRGPGAAYDRFVGRYSPALADAMIERSGVAPGQRALDVGCGSGALVAALAEVAGAENVAGVDPSEPFADAAREKVPAADIRVASAEALPFDDDSFDTTLSQLVVNFLSDPDQGLQEMARVTRPDGIVAGCVWDYGGEMTMLRTFWEAAVALDPAGAGPLVETHTMRFGTPEELGTLWKRAALADVEVSPIVVGASYEDFDDLWQPFTAGIGPAGAYTASLGEEARSALRDEYARRLGNPAGAFELTARAWCAVGSA